MTKRVMPSTLWPLLHSWTWWLCVISL